MANKKRYYIAYGSNLSVEQMAHRTPDAKIVGTAILQGWQLLFRQYATIRENPAYATPVLVWDISPQDEKNLDRYEGFPDFYFKKELAIKVTSLGGDRVKKRAHPVFPRKSGHSFLLKKYPRPFPR